MSTTEGWEKIYPYLAITLIAALLFFFYVAAYQLALGAYVMYVVTGLVYWLLRKSQVRED